MDGGGPPAPGGDYENPVTEGTEYILEKDNVSLIGVKGDGLQDTFIIDEEAGPFTFSDNEVVLHIEEVPSTSASTMPAGGADTGGEDDVHLSPLPPWLNPSLCGGTSGNEAQARTLMEEMTRACRAHTAACKAMEDFCRYRLNQIKKQ
ncbi:hypothetical protein Pcinc_013669 [Petrolisthes cinctipes]|uniref:Uncharacterized protein n=1 Tax=Petrolisthes cinctipes TaxID=88211 RepID=A0AAE1FR56_PETCI|nr:hypothetical protein Pcinc_017220 [Petrolisthes cinctipes]KAK3881905.1 hypothetical protein Pcinc_013669 [Petrolisthes cinctipes]